MAFPKQPALPMRPMVIDLRKTDDPRDVVHRAVQMLAEGRAVALPTETDYVVAASVRDAAAVARLAALVPERPGEPRLSLALKSADEALDWAPRLSPIGRRIARRCWPGPVTMLVADDHPESLVHRLAPSARGAIVGDGRLRLRVPGHPLLADCMRMLAGPVALAEPAATGESAPVTAPDVIARGGETLSLVVDDGRSRYAQPPSTIEVDDHGFRVVHPGIVSADTLRRLSSLMVLFVCTGNTCRSPMAEAIFKQLVAERLGCGPDEVDQHGVIVASAGIAAWGGGAASAGAIEAMREVGADLTGHESQPVTESLVRQADVIWTMTAAHRAAVVAQFPEAGGRTTILSPDRLDVIDPIGGPVATYRTCAEQIRQHLIARLDTIQLPPR
ncbi:MAG: translation factor [Planctomycetia bacterium]|nr:translation factor [Planctomycetia bacterium]